MSWRTACLLRCVCFGHLGVHFCQFWDFDRKILDLTIWSEIFPRARRTRREGVRVGVRGYVKAGVQWLYAQIRSDLSEHPFEAPGQLQRPGYLSSIYWEAPPAAAFGSYVRFGV